jgi:uncharacterized protein YukE
MADRVLSTNQAKDAIKKMQRIINSGLVEQITQLNNEGQTLSDRNVWDGKLAEDFRGRWPDIHNALNKAKNDLSDLSKDLEKIAANIMTAGGNQ